MDAVWDGRLDETRDEQVVGFGGRCGAPRCNQWGVCGIAVQKCMNRRAAVWGGAWVDQGWRHGLFPNYFGQSFIVIIVVLSFSHQFSQSKVNYAIIYNRLVWCICYRLPGDIAELNLTVEKTPRQDVVFIKKNGSQFHWHIHETLQMSNNKVDNFETVYTTMVLLFLELGADETILDILRLALEIQVRHLAAETCFDLYASQFVSFRLHFSWLLYYLFR